MKTRTILLAGAAMACMAQGAAAQEDLHFINCGSNDAAEAAVQAKHVAAWEAENPEFKVNMEYVPWGQCQEKAITLASAGSPAALAYLGSRVLPQLADAGLIEPVELSEEEAASYEPSVLGTISFNGQYWGVPRAFSTRALFYNKDLFEQAGLDMPDGPQTWDDVMTAARAITEKTDARGLGIAAASFDNTMHQFLSWLYANGGEVINSDGEVVFNSPETIETLQFYADMVPYAQEGPVAYDRGKLEPLFAEGKIAMMQQSFGFRARTGDANYGVTWVPTGPSGEGHSTLLITDSLAVFSGSGVEEAAMSLAKYLTATERQAEFDDVGGWTPVRDTELTRALPEKDPNWSYFLGSVAEGGPEPQVVDYNALQDVMNESIQGVILGELTPQEAAEEVADELNDLID
ncbi:ABC transporter substrate-binding protein [Paracoccus seriniphilus]|uniref:ABC transporter substrate-binding protein n=1 Tax=Paracoccus seriniphilus TaxID=184748 RepID=UPI003563C3D6